MTDGNLDNRVTDLEQRQQRQDALVVQIHEILLLSAQRIASISETLDRTARQQEINTREIAELKAIIRDQYRGNGHTPE